ncbi:MAG: hypothetical protein M3R55_17310, partial [Acidobacteriota bacterium]|nr:hypothetical protein [Acidobacteriota bacterium]
MEQDADREFLRNIAVWGKGRNHEVDDRREVPQVFVEEAERNARLVHSEKPVRPRVRDALLFDGVDLGNAPQLTGCTGTTAR